jgi:lysophospholipase
MACPAEYRRVLPPGFAQSRWIAPDGWDVRRFEWLGGTRGGLFWQGGRGDIVEKYLETLGHWHARGWHLAGFDWRGHGGSGRFDHDAGWTSEFAPALDDLAALWADWAARTPRPHVLAAHSLGGYLSLRAVLDGRVTPDALVLTAPMLGLRSPLGPALSERIARWQSGRGLAGQGAWADDRQGRGRIDRMALLTHDRDRYADEQWWHERLPDHRGRAPSWGWLHEAFAATRALRADPRLDALTTPTLVLVAERDRLVDATAAIAVAERLPAGELLRFGPESAHEILREVDAVRDRALATIDAFLDRVAP